MGAYINPPGQTKEEFLAEYGIEATLEEFSWEARPGCWIDCSSEVW